MQPIAVKTICTAAALMALAAAYLLISGNFERLILLTGPQKPAAAPIASNKKSAVGSLEVSEGSGEEAEFADPAAGVTRAFYKSAQSAPTEAVRLKIAVVEQNGELLINGSLFDGSACPRLHIELELEADDGRKLFHTLVLGDTGQTDERPLRSKRRLPPAAPELPAIWRAHVDSLRCLDP
jgi:hypothetical protein